MVKVTATTNVRQLTFREVSFQIALRANKMKNGELAELRRTGPHLLSPAFRGIFRQYERVMSQNLEAWVFISQAISILSNNTPTAKVIHDSSQGLGRVLANGGHSGGVGSSAFLSESRFMKFLRTPESKRGEALARVSRHLKQNFGVNGRINVCDMAQFVLEPENKEFQRRIAQQYYSAVYRMEKSKQGQS